MGVMTMANNWPITSNQQRHIFVVDDEPAIRTLITRVLSVRYRVTSSGNPNDALALAAQISNVNLLILDVMMPGMDGFTLAQRLRIVPGCAKAALLFLTAKDTAADKIRAIQAGARQYITKPFSIDDLLARVREILVE